MPQSILGLELDSRVLSVACLIVLLWMAFWKHQSGILPSEIKALEEKEKQAQLLRDEQAAERQRLSEKRQRLEELKLQLAKIEPLKEKSWDELTEDDEVQLDAEIQLREEIAELVTALGAK
eukprot:TRINITY_DN50372_c0_g1_i1.p2 TRINITY_DN50372_c0_g1~~TRINITY_DN50372_c0_g1_i1.p2  ORF type:complete len:121 (+),score=34.68 TRINITY_DN50372_c0_g1_i1:1090-1452(+)